MAPSRGQSICQTGGAGTHLLEEVREYRHTVRLGHQHGCWSVEDREGKRGLGLGDSWSRCRKWELVKLEQRGSVKLSE